MIKGGGESWFKRFYNRETNSDPFCVIQQISINVLFCITQIIFPFS